MIWLVVLLFVISFGFSTWGILLGVVQLSKQITDMKPERWVDLNVRVMAVKLKVRRAELLAASSLILIGIFLATVASIWGLFI